MKLKHDSESASIVGHLAEGWGAAGSVCVVSPEVLSWGGGDVRGRGTSSEEGQAYAGRSFIELGYCTRPVTSTCP